eukprot:EG_transcript_5477
MDMISDGCDTIMISERSGAVHDGTDFQVWATTTMQSTGKKRKLSEFPPTHQIFTEQGTLTQFLLKILQKVEAIDNHESIPLPEVTEDNLVSSLQYAALRCQSLLEVEESLQAVESSVDMEVSSIVDVGSSPPGLENLGPGSQTDEDSSSSMVVVEAHGPLSAVDSVQTLAAQRTLYADDILRVLLGLELQFAPNAAYLTVVQTQVTEGMRVTLHDWLFEVCRQFQLAHETFALTVNTVDRYLSVRFVERDRLQLVGITACCISAKFHEEDPPTTQQFLSISADTYTRREMLSMELDMLNVLQFRFNAPTALTFLGLFHHSHPVPAEVLCTALCLVHASFLSAQMLAHLPSVVASSCLHMAMQLHNVACAHSAGPPQPGCIDAMRACLGSLAVGRQTAIRQFFDSLEHPPAAMLLHPGLFIQPPQ